MAPPPGDPQPNLILAGEYPRTPNNSIVGLRVHLPTPAYMLAMKILANRLVADTERIESDLKDAVALMKVTKLTTEQQLVDLLKECYPNLPGIVVPSVHPRIKVKIDTLLDEYRRTENERDPSWHAGTGPATSVTPRSSGSAWLASSTNFYRHASDRSRAVRIAEDPGLTGDPRTDALLGAIGEHLAIRWNLGSAPEWTCQRERFLDRPWFMGHERMKGFLLAESPLAFRRRFIFTEAEPLRRARMPRDGRWWAYETIRTGMTPTAEEQAELDGQRAPATG